MSDVNVLANELWPPRIIVFNRGKQLSWSNGRANDAYRVDIVFGKEKSGRRFIQKDRNRALTVMPKAQAEELALALAILLGIDDIEYEG